jgi:hypothetical protein
MTVLEDQDLGSILRGLCVIVCLPIETQDHIGVLLDVSRLLEVRHHRSLVRPGLTRPIELRQEDHGALVLLGDGLARPRPLTHPLRAIRGPRVG